MEEKVSKRGARFKIRQKQLLLKFAKENPDILRTKLDDTFTAKGRSSLWKEVAALLNSDTVGAVKTPDEWRKTWNNWKSNVREKHIKHLNCGETTTAGSSANVKFSHVEQQLFGLIGMVNPESKQDVPETGILSPKNTSSTQGSANEDDTATGSSVTSHVEEFQFDEEMDTDERVLRELPDLGIVKQEPIDETTEESSATSSNISAVAEKKTNFAVSSAETILPTILPIIGEVKSIANIFNNTETSKKAKLCLKRPMSSVVEDRENKEGSRDEWTIFGEFIASKLRHISDRRSQLLAQNRITNILFEMEIERLNAKGSNSDQIASNPCVLPSTSTTTPLPIFTLVAPGTGGLSYVNNLKANK